jgi:nucleotide-binding universal stress UspA family protein
MLQRLVVGVNGSEASNRATSWSADLATALGAELIVVHVVPNSWLMEISALQVDTKNLVASWRAKLVGEWTEVLREKDVHYITSLLRGDPSAGLIGTAKERHADAIVVGNTHRTGLRGRSLGTTAHRVVNHSDVPVFVVPTHSDPPEEEWVPIPG